MGHNNGTEVTEFILLGFAGQHKFWHILFMVFLVTYAATLLGNVGMILLIKSHSSLHTPMYFLLQHLAFVDLCYASAITPKMLQNFLCNKQSISFTGCLVQLLVYGTFVTSDCYILAAMAVDRYVAICNPLHYPTVMSRRRCIQLLLGNSQPNAASSLCSHPITRDEVTPVTWALTLGSTITCTHHSDAQWMLKVKFGFSLHRRCLRILFLQLAQLIAHRGLSEGFPTREVSER
ncbi:Hypothetical predicted protein [Marmota monax]|uniref:G-protein coupled receptors family 1 profile domain-containing protein n=1 Tax=Marmota monax TaxID=9995 RepID=A0A5E4BCT7_MARMO|nr:Hypothetical predicted protein [Marmota monax]